MTASVEATSPAKGRSERWLFGPIPDLLFGAGLLYVGFFALQTLAGDAMRDVWPLAFFPLLTLLLGAPHYGATLLRVYENRDDRRRYALFAVYFSAAIAVLYVLGLRFYLLGSVLITIYVTWSPWHYSGQNYGVSLLFLRRAGVAIDPSVKRLLYASFLMSAGLFILLLHTSYSGEAFQPDSYMQTVYQVIVIGVPVGVLSFVFPALVALYLASLAGVTVLLMRRAAFRDIAPALLMIFVQGLWFAAPAIALQYEALQVVDPLNTTFRNYAFMWVAGGHFVQYLWITLFYAVRSAEPGAQARFLGKALCAGALLWVLPVLIVSPLMVGTLPASMGLVALTAAVVNLHHFVLDGAIWKLRDGRVARALLRREAAGGDPAPTVVGGSASKWVWASGALCVVVYLALAVDGLQAQSKPEGPMRDQAVRAQQERRALVARGQPGVILGLGERRLARGDFVGAREDAAWSLSLFPTSGAHLVVGIAHEKEGKLEAAAEAFSAALAIDPEHAMAHARLAIVQSRLGRIDQARATMKRARRLDPDDARIAAASERLNAMHPGPVKNAM